MTAILTVWDIISSGPYEDRAGGLWFGTWGGVDTYYRTTAQFTNYAPDPNVPQSLNHKNIQSIYQDQAGVVWIGTSDGLNRWDRATDQFFYYIYDDDDPQSLSEGHINAIYEGRSGTLWIGTQQNGLSTCDREMTQ
jgi:ligand-binding sensor domain-containing protein